MPTLTPPVRGIWRLAPAALLLLLSVLFTMNCQTETAEDAQTAPKEEMTEAVQRYALHGKIVKLDDENKIAAIDHDEIVGWMGAMTMEFPVRDQADWEKLHTGDEINATVFVDDSGFHIGEVEVLAPTPAEGERPKE